MLESILKERGDNYGSYHTHANLTQTLNNIILNHFVNMHPKEQMPHFMAETIHMICHKLARIVNGNPLYEDSWQDIAGYSQLVVDILQEAKAAQAQAEAEDQNITNEEETGE